MRSIIRRYRVQRSQIAFLRFTLEAYEGLAMMSTCDRQKAVVEMKIAPGFAAAFDRVIADLRKDLLIEEIL